MAQPSRFQPLRTKRLINTGITVSRVFSDIYILIRENDCIKKGCIVRTVNTAVSMLFGKKRSKLLRPYVIKKIIRIQPKKKNNQKELGSFRDSRAITISLSVLLQKSTFSTD